MKYAFILDNRHSWSIAAQCRALKVSRSGFYAWLIDETSDRSQANQVLDLKIIDIFKTHKKRYGVMLIS